MRDMEMQIRSGANLKTKRHRVHSRNQLTGSAVFNGQTGRLLKGVCARLVLIAWKPELSISDGDRVVRLRVPAWCQ